MRVAVLTTSYPRHEEDFAGRFVADAVAHLRAHGVAVDVVAPGVYRDFGISEEGRGVVNGLRRRPWLAPALAISMATKLRQVSRDADLVHAHWLAGAVVAAFAGRPFVVTLHGSVSAGRFDDFALARRAPRLVRLVLRRARVVICVSNALADAARQAGAENVTVIPNGIEIPADVGPEADPPYVLFAGRLSPEKGVTDFMAATNGLNVVVAGDGPLRDQVPSGLGFVDHDALGRLFSAAAVVACPSRSEGFGMVCAEAMSHGRPVVASGVGGLLDLVVHEETGLLVPPRDPRALREALERLLADRALRKRLGTAARAHITELCAWPRVTERTIAEYRRALGARP